jgi:hypothetical protein
VGPRRQRPGELGEDGDGGTSSANGGLDGSGNNSGGDYVGVIDGRWAGSSDGKRRAAVGQPVGLRHPAAAGRVRSL